MSEVYYIDILKKLVGRKQPIEHDELCCLRLSYEAFTQAIAYMEQQGWVEEIIQNGKVHYASTYEGNMYIINLLKADRERNEAKKDPYSIRFIQEKLNSCWISVNEFMPEEATEIEFTDLNVNFKFVTVLTKNDNGVIEVRNRILQTPTGNKYLDASIKTIDWHWSQGSFEPTYWMPMPR